MSQDQATQDQTAEALRQAISALPRYSFHTDGKGGVVKVPDRCGRWIEWDAVHELCDPVMVDAAIAKLIAKAAIKTAAG